MRGEIFFSYSDSYQSSDLPCGPSAMEQSFKKLLKLLKNDPQFLNAHEILGAAVGRLGIYICSDVEMRAYQKSYRKLDRSTDVLSFPTLELKSSEIKMLPQSELSLGDLIVSLPAISRGARRGRRSEAEEFTEVFVHGVLHLLGYDHVLKNAGVSPKKAQQMRKLQKELFWQVKPIIKKNRYVRKRMAKKS